MIVADVSKLKKGNSRLGVPPSMDEAATSLAAPEIAPAPLDDHQPYIRRDGRSARKTNRTLAFATRVSPEFDAELRDIAEEKNLKLVELLEEMLEAYKQKNNI
ncbi:Uncharacterised protein [Yersinia enterocolitica]|jgi:hypothetical protein|uniref:Orf78 n=2 Tax=Yersinia enterocolitica TaxID=630 RepID=Q93KR2_YEREN|nr:hypothetical protein [Yersinia enterocolitica]EKA25170.1 hypothetical protein YWA314_20762 [Yersinia enterocolitica subsp. enterocolitica WA-314]CAL10091.1 hypothetical protein YEP0071 [Yersinia enterocolitica subsp. enterocolitica 8081]CBW54737.1 p62 in pYVa127/90, putative DNA-binding protein with local similarity to proteins that control plasmid replication [Yersinia enterocolitica (type O:8)]AAK69265.1 unknown [Yersinia enterocolitica]AAN37567.1 Orf78 [Yersinia enterocolitica]